VLAASTTLAVVALASRRQVPRRGTRWLAFWSDASYGVFLVHYAVIVATTALWLRLGMGGTAAAWGVLATCWAASLAAGAALERWVGVPLSRQPWAGSGRLSTR
jgi:peptidoglycan/LPS O-acetylase OafA/YrhL